MIIHLNQKSKTAGDEKREDCIEILSNEKGIISGSWWLDGKIQDHCRESLPIVLEDNVPEIQKSIRTIMDTLLETRHAYSFLNAIIEKEVKEMF